MNKENKALWEARTRIDDYKIERIDLYVDGKFYQMEDGFNALIELGKKLGVEEFKKRLVEEIGRVSLEKFNNAQHQRILSGGDEFELEMWWTEEILDLINNLK